MHITSIPAKLVLYWIASLEKSSVKISYKQEEFWSQILWQFKAGNEFIWFEQKKEIL